jgi:hypothetical protein
MNAIYSHEVVLVLHTGHSRNRVPVVLSSSSMHTNTQTDATDKTDRVWKT